MKERLQKKIEKAETRLNNLELRFDQIREFLGVKTFFSNSLGYNSWDNTTNCFDNCKEGDSKCLENCYYKYATTRWNLASSTPVFDFNQMMNEYNDLIICYANAQTYAQLAFCEQRAQAFTDKYG